MPTYRAEFGNTQVDKTANEKIWYFYLINHIKELNVHVFIKR